MDFGAKQVSGGELKKLVRRYVVEEMLHLNTVDSLLLSRPCCLTEHLFLPSCHLYVAVAGVVVGSC